MHSLTKDQKIENYVELLEQKQKKLARLTEEVNNLKKKITLLQQVKTTSSNLAAKSVTDRAQSIINNHY